MSVTWKPTKIQVLESGKNLSITLEKNEGPMESEPRPQVEYPISGFGFKSR